jgi:isopenicillin N synthase-like dioxygenase
MNAIVPIIDLSQTYGADQPQILLTARKLDDICRIHGFFYVTGHTVAPAVVHRMFEFSKIFFDLSDAEKSRCNASQSRYRRGYEPQGLQALNPGQPADLKESYTVGWERTGDDVDMEPRRGDNLWPSESAIPGFRQNVEAYILALDRLGHHIMGLMAVGLGLPRTYFEPFLKTPVSSLRLLHYPPQPARMNPGQLGAGAHTDWGALTLLAQDDVGGLQVRHKAGEWHSVPPIPHSFVVNIGDMMSRWSNDAYQSTLHRVINPLGGVDRYSIPYFFDVDHFAVVQALPGTFSPSNPPRYSPATAGQHFMEKANQSRLVGSH